MIVCCFLSCLFIVMNIYYFFPTKKWGSSRLMIKCFAFGRTSTIYILHLPYSVLFYHILILKYITFVIWIVNIMVKHSPWSAYLHLWISIGWGALINLSIRLVTTYFLFHEKDWIMSTPVKLYCTFSGYLVNLQIYILRWINVMTYLYF
jgi:hypothetical protein